MTWIQTFSGRKFSLVDPQPEDVCIEDVIAALTNICRFNGHCREFYSVAQHCLEVANEVSVPFRYEALLHDAPEAYYGDITRPQKIVYRTMTHHETRCGPMCDFDMAIGRIDAVVAEALGYSHPVSYEVKYADNVMLATEARDLMGPPPEPWVELPPPRSRRVEPMTPTQVYYQFCEAFHKYRDFIHA